MSFKKVPTPSNLAGVGLRSQYVPHFLKNPRKISKKIGWIEIHSENYYDLNSVAVKNLITIRQDFPLSLHSVGNSLGSSQKLDLNHLKKLKALAEITQPFLISDHISWGRINKNHLNDLLPLPYTKESLQAITDNILQMQDFLKSQILIENPSAYLAFKKSEMSEADFINEITAKTGCALLLDVNNIFVSWQNCAQFEPINYLKKLNKKIVKEIHLAGHSQSEIFDGKKHKKILIDTHNNLVNSQVWQIYKMAIEIFGKVPSLIEWDQDFPDFEVLLGESKKAKKILENEQKKL
ncbi:MAG: DUF692 domain-containing protein [Rickettsiales bacterium]|nr:DUF692 domain-containing protein [Rickettsiales bacterium]